MEFVIDKKDLLAALKEIKLAEKNGFMYCRGVFSLTKAGRSVDDCVAEYVDLMEKAHPTDGNLDWGRGQDVTKDYKFVNGELVEAEQVSSEKGEKGYTDITLSGIKTTNTLVLKRYSIYILTTR